MGSDLIVAAFFGFASASRSELDPGGAYLEEEYPKAKETDPSSIIDATIMKRIEQSGFIKALCKK